MGYEIYEIEVNLLEGGIIELNMVFDFCVIVFEIVIVISGKFEKLFSKVIVFLEVF